MAGIALEPEQVHLSNTHISTLQNGGRRPAEIAWPSSSTGRDPTVFRRGGIAALCTRTATASLQPAGLAAAHEVLDQAGGLKRDGQAGPEAHRADIDNDR